MAQILNKTTEYKDIEVWKTCMRLPVSHRWKSWEKIFSDVMILRFGLNEFNDSKWWSTKQILGYIERSGKNFDLPNKGVLSTAPSYLMNILHITAIKTSLLCNEIDTSTKWCYRITEDMLVKTWLRHIKDSSHA